MMNVNKVVKAKQCVDSTIQRGLYYDNTPQGTSPDQVNSFKVENNNNNDSMSPQNEGHFYTEQGTEDFTDHYSESSAGQSCQDNMLIVGSDQ